MYAWQTAENYIYIYWGGSTQCIGSMHLNRRRRELPVQAFDRGDHGPPLRA